MAENKTRLKIQRALHALSESKAEVQAKQEQLDAMAQKVKAGEYHRNQLQQQLNIQMGENAELETHCTSLNQVMEALETRCKVLMRRMDTDKQVMDEVNRNIVDLINIVSYSLRAANKHYTYCRTNFRSRSWR